MKKKTLKLLAILLIILILYITFGFNASNAETVKTMKIVIDPGHGGHETGAINYTDGIIEKDINLKTARYLSNRGVKTRLCQDTGPKWEYSDGTKADYYGIIRYAMKGNAEDRGLDKTSVNMIVGDKTKIDYTINPSTAVNKKVNWTTNNSKIATVDNNGNITAVGEGTATITATADGNDKVSSKIEVTVIDPCVTSSNTGVVTVESTNWVDREGTKITAKAVSAGSATITVTPEEVVTPDEQYVTGSGSVTINVKAKEARNCI